MVARDSYSMPGIAVLLWKGNTENISTIMKQMSVSLNGKVPLKFKVRNYYASQVQDDVAKNRSELELL